jgi:RimJ/RimL family protein N-acetyltransferase
MVDDMPDSSQLNQFSQTSALRDGTPVTIRAAHADDRQRFVDAFHKLDPQTIHTRFFSFRKELSETELGRLDASETEQSFMLAATLGSGVDEAVIAAASCVVLDTAGRLRAAEVGFTVEEDYQRQGLAGKLQAVITSLAPSRGIGRLEAEVLASNQAMLSVFKRSGLPMSTTRSQGVVHLVLDLSTKAARRSSGAENQ